MSSDLVTVESFWSLDEAQLACGFLESHGIHCELEGAVVTGIVWHLSNATGGVKLQVLRSDATHAAELLREVEQHQHRVADDYSDDARFNEADQNPKPLDMEHSEVERPEGTDAGNDDPDLDEYTGVFDRLKSSKRVVLGLILMPVLIGAGMLLLFILLSIATIFFPGLTVNVEMDRDIIPSIMDS